IDVIAEHARLDTKLVSACEQVIIFDIETELTVLAGFRPQIEVRNKLERRRGRMLLRDQRFGHRRRAIAFSVAEVRLESGEGSYPNRDFRRKSVAVGRKLCAGGGVDTRESEGIVTKRRYYFEPR